MNYKLKKIKVTKHNFNMKYYHINNEDFGGSVPGPPWLRPCLAARIKVIE